MLAIQTNPDSLQSLRTLPWIDQVGLALLALFLFLGFWRGLWWQVMRLVGVAASVLLARSLTPRFSPELEASLNLDSSATYGLVWFGLFAGGLILASVAGLLGKRALDALALGWLDRFGGAMAGGLTGLILHGAWLLLAIGVGTTDWSTDTLRGTRSQRLIDVVSNRWPILVDARVSEKLVRPWADALGLERYPRPGENGDLELDPLPEQQFEQTGGDWAYEVR